jgi:hypothetical protein
MKKFWLYLLGSCLPVVAFPAAAQDNNADEKQEDYAEPVRFRLSTGLNYSIGDYGDTVDTKVVSLPLSVKLSKGPLSFRISSAYVRIIGPSSLIDTPQDRGGGSGGGGGSDGSGSGSSGNDVIPDDSGTVPANNQRNGFGDLNVAMTYSFDFGDDLYLDVTGKVKLPTASTSKRLGTGKVDVTAGLDLIKDIDDASIYVAGYRRFNGSTAARPLRDVWGFAAGASYRINDTVVVGGDYDWQQSSFAGNGPSSEITGWSSFKLTDVMRLTIFASTGLSTNSADFATGATVSFRM